MFYDTFVKLFKKYRPKTINVYTGGALGTDQIAFMAANEFKQKYGNRCNVNNIMCIPNKQYNNNWNASSISIHKQLKVLADNVINVSTIQGYITDNFNGQYDMRNRYMIDKGNDYLIALYDGSSKGGTYNAIKYAKKQDREIIYLPMDYIDEVANAQPYSFFK